MFKVKYGICSFSANNGPIATKQKSSISIELWASNVNIGFDLGYNLDLEFSRSNIKFVISQPKMVQLPWNEKQTCWLNLRPQMWPSGLSLAMSLTLKYGICYIPTKKVRLPRNDKQTYRMNSRPQMWPVGFTLQWPWSLNIQGQMWPLPLTICMVLTKEFHGQILK